ncbi:amidase family protein [Microbacterium soli]|uniref:Amidase n=1 Tax=Microbacterium soli TaxID=446075 RepID=A0ABP7NKA4_9MICO
MDITLLPAIEQARMIRRGELTAVELLEAVSERYQQVNHHVNAVVVTQWEQARRRAEAADRALRESADIGALHGVPITVKESFDWYGTASTFGNVKYADNYPARNAILVDRLLAAGANLYGKTNVPENLSDSQAFNDIYGTTSNPWDIERVPGGSSGGSAVAVATGMAAMELGSDVAGSLRNPAHFCGVFAHKPTYGAVPMQGHAPPGKPAEVDMLVAGPLARTADDLVAGMSVLTGRDPMREERDLSQFRVAFMFRSTYAQQDPELVDQLQSAVDDLARRGVHVREAGPDFDADQAYEDSLLLLRAATSSAMDPEDIASLRPLARRFDEGHRDRQAFLAKGTTLSAAAWRELDESRTQNRRRWASFFDDYDVLLCPAANSAAGRHDHSPERFDARRTDAEGNPVMREERLYWAMFSGAAYLPSTIVPAGTTGSGMPCGIQIVAPHDQDHVSLAFAQHWEREICAYTPPPALATWSGAPN